MRKIGDQRQSTRFIVSSNNLQAEVIDSGDYPELTGINLAGNALNISPEGIQLALKHHIPVGSMLDIWVVLPKDSNEQTFHLTGQIRWIRLTESERSYISGIKLKPVGYTDIDQWQNLDFSYQ